MLTSLTLIALMAFGLIEARADESVFLDSSLSKVTPTDAMLKGLRGEVTYKCQPQEFKVGKSGTTGGLKTKKKKITKEQAEQLIKETQERIEK